MPAAPDLNLLPALDALLSEASVTRAAERLQLSESAMSRTLARLRALPDGAPLILWLDVPHVLYRGEVPLGALGEVRC